MRSDRRRPSPNDVSQGPGQAASACRPGATVSRGLLCARSFVCYWLPVLLWAGFIFWMSTEAGSTRHTSRIIGPVLRWLYPGVQEATVARVQFFVRKTAHFSEYALLALLVWRARRRPAWNDPRSWSWPEARFVLLTAALFAASDEFHQTFVPGREGQVTDALLDTAGASGGLGVAWAAVTWLDHRRLRRAEKGAPRSGAPAGR